MNVDDAVIRCIVTLEQTLVLRLEGGIAVTPERNSYKAVERSKCLRRNVGIIGSVIKQRAVVTGRKNSGGKRSALRKNIIICSAASVGERNIYDKIGCSVPVKGICEIDSLPAGGR